MVIKVVEDLDALIHEKFSRALSLRVRARCDTTFYDLGRIENSIRSGTFQFFMGAGGVDLGYVAWANLNREAFDDFSLHGKVPEYRYEWLEGSYTLILDVLFAGIDNLTARDQLLLYLRGRGTVGWCRDNKISIFRKKWRRSTIARSAAASLHVNELSSSA